MRKTDILNVIVIQIQKKNKWDKGREYKEKDSYFQNECSVIRDFNEIRDRVMKRSEWRENIVARQQEPHTQIFQEGTSLVLPESHVFTISTLESR